MLIAALQMQPVAGDVTANRARIDRAAETARSMGAGLLVTPELSLTGYGQFRRFDVLAEPKDGPMVAGLQQLADRLDLAIAAGFPERDGEAIYNTAVTVRPRAAPVFYRKTHLYGPMENRTFRRGTAIPEVFALGSLRAAMLICYDVEFPEMVRGLAMAGADLLIVPTALPRGRSARHCAQLLVPARAMESQVFIAYADLCGSEDRIDYEGRSVIAGPDGEALARAGEGETLLFAEIDREAPAFAENSYRQDVLPELYAQFAPLAAWPPKA